VVTVVVLYERRQPRFRVAFIISLPYILLSLQPQLDSKTEDRDSEDRMVDYETPLSLRSIKWPSQLTVEPRRYNTTKTFALL